MVMPQTQTPAEHLEAASDSLRDAERQYNAVLADFKKWTTTGSAAMDEGIREATEAHLTPGIRAAEAKAMAAANAASDAARSILQRGQSPRLNVSDDDTIRAAASYPRLKDRVASRPFAELVASVQAALDADDRADLLNLYDLLLPRLDADPSGLSPKEKAARSDLRSLRSEIFDRMRDRSYEAYEDDALEIITNASELRKRAGKYVRENAPKRTYAFHKPGDYIIPADAD